LKTSPKIGLVLSGGGARGFAHLGMIKALQENNVEISAVSGTSAGALIGAFFCQGYSPDETLEIIEKTSLISSLRPSFNRRSLLKIESAYKELIKYFTHDSFDKLTIPLYVTATDIVKAEQVIFNSGPLIKPLLASSSIPVVFDPIVFNGKTLIDGGIMDNLPHLPLKEVCDKIIGMHSNPLSSDYHLTNWKSLIERSLMMTVTQNVYSKSDQFDLFLEPGGIGVFKVFDFKSARKIFNLGYQYLKEEISKGVLDKLKIQ